MLIEDIWGAHRRLDAIPDVICTLDSIGFDKIRSNFIYKKTDVYITGSPAFDSLSYYYSPSPDLIERAGELEFNKENIRNKLGLSFVGSRVMLFAAPGFSQDTLEILSALEKIFKSVEINIIPRLHPKLKDLDPKGWDKCEKIISEGGNNIILRPLADMNDLIFSSDYVISTYFTALLIAAYLESIPISFVSPGIKENMMREIGYERYPLIDIRCAYEVESATDIIEILKKVPPGAMKENELALNFNCGATHRVVKVIDNILR